MDIELELIFNENLSDRDLFKMFKEEDIHYRSFDGSSLLMYAKTCSQTHFLINQGIDVNSRNRDGQTALMYARNFHQIIKLIEHRANVNYVDIHGETALDYAKDFWVRIILRQYGGLYGKELYKN